MIEQVQMGAAGAPPHGDGHAASKAPGGLVIFDATAANPASATLVAVGRAPAHVIVDALVGSERT